MPATTTLPTASDYTFHKGTFAELEATLAAAAATLTWEPARKRFVEILDAGACHPRLALRLALIRQGREELEAELGMRLR